MHTKHIQNIQKPHKNTYKTYKNRTKTHTKYTKNAHKKHTRTVAVIPAYAVDERLVVVVRTNAAKRLSFCSFFKAEKKAP